MEYHKPHSFPAYQNSLASGHTRTRRDATLGNNIVIKLGRGLSVANPPRRKSKDSPPVHPARPKPPGQPSRLAGRDTTNHNDLKLIFCSPRSVEKTVKIGLMPYVGYFF